MFKLAKYYVLLNLYKRSKRNIITIVISLVLMILVSYIFADIINIRGNENSYGLIVIKWLMLLTLVFVMVFNVRKMIKIVSTLFWKERKEDMPDIKKEMILGKEHLMSRSDLIIGKYRSSK